MVANISTKDLPSIVIKNYPHDYWGNGRRGSGRTHQMLLAAHRAKLSGESVAIIIPSTNHFRHLREMIYRNGWCLTPNDFHLLDTGRHFGAHIEIPRGAGGYRLFFDHTVLEEMEQYWHAESKHANSWHNPPTFQGHQHDFKYESMDEDETEKWVCSCGEIEYRDEDSA